MSAGRVVFMGTPPFAAPSLLALAEAGYDIAAVYTQPDRPAGRARAMRPSAVKVAAEKLGLPIRQPTSLRSAEAAAELAALAPTVIVVAAFGQILRQAVLDIPLKGVVGVHPSLLPCHRGAAPVAAAILAGDEVTGVTLLLLDAGVDAGPILAQRTVLIEPADNTGSLTRRLAQVGADLLAEMLPRWLAGELQPRPQDPSRATYAPMIRKEEGAIDWLLPTLTTWRRVRAFNPWPGAYTFLDGEMLHVWEAWPLPDGQGVGDEPGTVLALTLSQEQQLPAGTPLPAVGVRTGDGLLAVLNVQRAGRRAMAAAAFLRGQRGLWGRRLGGQ